MSDADALPDVDALTDNDPDSVAEALLEADTDVLTLCDTDGVTEVDDVGVSVDEGDALADGVADGEMVVLALVDGEAEPVGDTL